MKRSILFLLMISITLLTLAGCSVPKENPAPTPDQPVEGTVTQAQREAYFDFSRRYRVDRIPDFQPGDSIDLEGMKRYAVAMNWDTMVQTDNKGSINGEAINRAAAYFDTSYPLDPEASVPLEIGAVPGKPLLELVSYKEEPLGENKKITVELEYHYFFEMEHSTDQENEKVVYTWDYLNDPNYGGSENTVVVYTLMEKENLSFFEAAKKLIVTGQTQQLDAPLMRHVLEYETADGITPIRFISKTTVYPSTNG